MIISMPFRGRFLHVMQVSRKCLTTKSGDLATLCQELKVEVQFLGEHLFRANWQQSQFHKMRNRTPFPKAAVMMVMDFAENYTCQYQGEVQAAHWHHEQATVHPTVTYYRFGLFVFFLLKIARRARSVCGRKKI